MKTNLAKYPVVFFAGLFSIITASFFVVSSQEFFSQPEILSLGLTFDITIGIPLLFYFTIIRKYRISFAAIIPVFVASILCASFILPLTHQSYLDIVKNGVIFAELGAVSFLAINIRRIVVEYKKVILPVPDFIERFSRAVNVVFKNAKLSSIAANEISAGYYLLFFRKKKEVSPGQLQFTYHKKSGYVEFIIAMFFALGIETFLLHYFLSQWNNLISIVIIIVSAYSMLFFVADAIASVKRPVVKYENNLYVRTGLRWRITIPMDLIQSVIETKLVDKSDNCFLNASLLGQVNFEVILNDYVSAIGLFGVTKKVNRIYLQLDNISLFKKSL